MKTPPLASPPPNPKHLARITPGEWRTERMATSISVVSSLDPKQEEEEEEGLEVVELVAVLVGGGQRR